MCHRNYFHLLTELLICTNSKSTVWKYKFELRMRPGTHLRLPWVPTSETSDSGLLLDRTVNNLDHWSAASSANLAENVPPEELIQRKSLKWLVWENKGIPAQLRGYCVYLEKFQNGKKRLRWWWKTKARLTYYALLSIINLYITLYVWYVYSHNSRIYSYNYNLLAMSGLFCIPCCLDGYTSFQNISKMTAEQPGARQSWDLLPDQRERGNCNRNITGTFATLQKIQYMLVLPNNKKKKD